MLDIQTGPVFDKNRPDPAKETERRFGRVIERMKKIGTIPEDWQEGVSGGRRQIPKISTRHLATGARKWRRSW